MPSTCAIYCRISMDRTGQQFGVQRQEQECRALATQLGLAVQRVFVDNDISAFSGKKRPAFQALLASGPEAIVTWHLDRLVRRTLDLEPVLALGVNVYTVAGGMQDLSTPQGRAVAKTAVTWAQYESEQKGERQKSMHRQRRARGEVWWHGRAPIGFDKDGTVVDAELVRSMYDDFLAGAGLESIGRRVGLGGGGVRAALMSERNAAVVGDTTWDAANRILRGRHWSGPRAASMLAGVLVCGRCQGPCRAGRQRRAPDKEWYRCANGHVWWPRDEVDAYVGGQVAKVLELNRALIEDRAADDSAEVGELTADFMSGRLSATDFAAAMERVRARAAKPSAPWVPWDRLTLPERRSACQILLERVVLQPRGHWRGPQLPIESLDLQWRTTDEGH